MSMNFDRVSNLYDATRSMPGGMREQANALLVKEGGIVEGSRVIELGIGTGRIALPIVEAVPVKYFGVDISDLMMGKIREKHPNKIHLAKADVCRLPFKSGSFDCAIAVHIFHLVPAWRDSITETERVLKKGAPLLIADEGGRRTFWLDFLAGDMPESVRRELEDIAIGLGMMNKIGMDGLDDAEELLVKSGAVVSKFPTIENKVEMPVMVLPALVSGRVFSSLWDLPQETIDIGAKRLTETLNKNFGSLDKKFTMTRKFDLLKAVFG